MRAATRRSSQATVDLSHVIFTGEKFVAVGGSWESGAVTVTSLDGTSWSPVESPSTYMFHAAAHGDGTLIAAAYYRSDLQTPALFTAEVTSSSSIATGWSERRCTDFYDSITIGDEIVVVGETSVATSRDGRSWTERQLPGSRLVSSVAWSGTTLAIVGELGTIYTSPNGIDWVPRDAATASSLRGVTHGDAMFVAVGGGGAIVTSLDGSAWVTQRSETTNALTDVSFGPTP